VRSSRTGSAKKTATGSLSFFGISIENEKEFCEAKSPCVAEPRTESTPGAQKKRRHMAPFFCSKEVEMEFYEEKLPGEPLVPTASGE